MKRMCYMVLFVAISAKYANSAEPVTLKLAGRVDMMFGAVNQTQAYNATYVYDGSLDLLPGSGARLPSAGLVEDAAVQVYVDSDKSKQLTYGAYFNLHANTSRASNMEPYFTDKIMAYVQHNKIGRVEVGAYPGAASMFEMQSFIESKAAYGVEGFFSRFTNDTTKFAVPSFLTSQPQYLYFNNFAGYRYLISPNLPSNYSGNSYSDAPKINFYTQPIENLTLAVNYIPDLDAQSGIVNLRTKDGGPVDAERRLNRGTFRNIIGLGARYTTAIQDVKFISYIAAEFGTAKRYKTDAVSILNPIPMMIPTGQINDLRAYEVGVSLGYKDFGFVSTFGDWGKTGTYKYAGQGTKQSARYWTLLGTYTHNKFGASIGYMNSSRAGGLEAPTSQLLYMGTNGEYPIVDYANSDYSHNKLHVASFGLEYDFNFLKNYAEIVHASYKNDAISERNNLTTFIIGIRITF